MNAPGTVFQHQVFGPLKPLCGGHVIAIVEAEPRDFASPGFKSGRQRTVLSTTCLDEVKAPTPIQKEEILLNGVCLHAFQKMTKQTKMVESVHIRRLFRVSQGPGGSLRPSPGSTEAPGVA